MDEKKSISKFTKMMGKKLIQKDHKYHGRYKQLQQDFSNFESKQAQNKHVNSSPVQILKETEEQIINQNKQILSCKSQKDLVEMEDPFECLKEQYEENECLLQDVNFEKLV